MHIGQIYCVNDSGLCINVQRNLTSPISIVFEVLTIKVEHLKPKIANSTLK